MERRFTSITQNSFGASSFSFFPTQPTAFAHNRTHGSANGQSTPPPASRSPVSTRLNYNSPVPRSDFKLDFNNASLSVASSASFGGCANTTAPPQPIFGGMGHRQILGSLPISGNSNGFSNNSANCPPSSAASSGPHHAFTFPALAPAPSFCPNGSTGNSPLVNNDTFTNFVHPHDESYNLQQPFLDSDAPQLLQLTQPNEEDETDASNSVADAGGAVNTHAFNNGNGDVVGDLSGDESRFEARFGATLPMSAAGSGVNDFLSGFAGGFRFGADDDTVPYFPSDNEERMTPRITSGHDYHGGCRGHRYGGRRGSNGFGRGNLRGNLDSPAPSVQITHHNQHHHVTFFTPSCSVTADSANAQFMSNAAAMQTPQTSRVRAQTREFLDAELNGTNTAFRTYAPPLVTQISNDIFLGGYPNSHTRAELRARGVTNMINCCAGQKKLSAADAAGFNIFSIFAEDHADYYILMNHLAAFIDEVEAVIGRGEKVFVHCMGGVNRSVSLVVGYMMERMKYSPIDAVRHFRQQGRNVILDNLSFRRELVDHYLQTCRPDLEH